MKVAQLSPTLCEPMDYTVHGILQARILEWIAFPFSKGSSQPRDQTQVSCIADRFFYQLSHKGSTSKKNDPKQFSFQLTLSFSTANNGSGMLCHYIQKQDNLGCPLQCPQVQFHSAHPELQPLWKALTHSLHTQQGTLRVYLSCFVFTNYTYVQLRTWDFQPMTMKLTHILTNLKKNARNIFKCLVIPTAKCRVRRI